MGGLPAALRKFAHELRVHRGKPARFLHLVRGRGPSVRWVWSGFSLAMYFLLCVGSLAHANVASHARALVARRFLQNAHQLVFGAFACRFTLAGRNVVWRSGAGSQMATPRWAVRANRRSEATWTRRREGLPSRRVRTGPWSSTMRGRDAKLRRSCVQVTTLRGDARREGELRASPRRPGARAADRFPRSPGRRWGGGQELPAEHDASAYRTREIRRRLQDAGRAPPKPSTPMRIAVFQPPRSTGPDRQEDRRDDPCEADEEREPNEVSTPSPGFVPERADRSTGGRLLGAASLEIPRVWRTPAPVAPAVTERRHEEEKHEHHPHQPP